MATTSVKSTSLILVWLVFGVLFAYGIYHDLHSEIANPAAWEREIGNEFARAMQAIGDVKKHCLTKAGLLGSDSACKEAAMQLREQLVKVSALATSPPTQDKILVYKAKRLGALARGGIQLLDTLQALSLAEIGKATKQLEELLRQLETAKRGGERV
jgi:hypothetical protein